MNTPPLADREVIVAVVLSDDVAVDVDDLARGLAGRDARLPFDDFRVAVLLGDEADLVRLFLSSHGETALFREIANLRFGQLAKGEECLAELLLGELEKKVALVLGPVSGFVKREPVALAHDSRVVTGGNLLRPDRTCLLVEQIELH